MASSFAVIQSAPAGMFALIGLVLAATGIYRVVAYRTQMRTHADAPSAYDHLDRGPFGKVVIELRD